MIPAYRQRNYFQSALYVIIAGTLAAVLLERLLTYAEAAEKAAMEVTLSQLHSNLYARVAFLALRGEYAAIDALASQSPFLTTQARSPNYLGEFDGEAADVKGGQWFFDRVRNELVYVPNLKRYLTAASGGQSVAALRFRLEVQKASTSGYTGVTLRPTSAFAWIPVP